MGLTLSFRKISLTFAFVLFCQVTTPSVYADATHVDDGVGLDEAANNDQHFDAGNLLDENLPVYGPEPQPQNLGNDLAETFSFWKFVALEVARGVGRLLGVGIQQVYQGAAETLGTNQNGGLGGLVNEQAKTALKGLGATANDEAAAALGNLGEKGNEEVKKFFNNLGEVGNDQATKLIDGLGDKAAKQFADFAKKAGEGGNEGVLNFFRGFDVNIFDFLGQVGNRAVAAGDYLRGMMWSAVKAYGAIAGVTVVAIVAIAYLEEYIEKRLFQPNLAIEESEYRVLAYIKSLFFRVPSIEDLVFLPTTKEEIEDYVAELRAAYRHGVAYPTLLLYGPPGTGKTAVAKIIAKQEGFTYVFLSGSSFSQFSEDQGLAEMSQLFTWAKRQGKVLIFLDEIESFLGTRESTGMSEKTRKFLTHFLTYTGEKSDRYTLIGATNKPSDLDPAVLRRFTNAIEIGLPNLDARKDLFRIYFDKLILNDQTFGFIEVEDDFLSDPNYIEQVAKRTEGFSGADIQDVVETSKLLVLGMDEPILTPATIDKALRRLREKYHKLRDSKKSYLSGPQAPQPQMPLSEILVGA